MKNIRMRSDWLRVALLLSEISRSIGSFGVVNKINKLHMQCSKCLFTIIISLRCKQSVLVVKDEQSIISELEKGEIGTNMSAEYAVSKQQITDIHNNKEKIMKFADNLETSEGLQLKSL